VLKHFVVAVNSDIYHFVLPSTLNDTSFRFLTYEFRLSGLLSLFPYIVVLYILASIKFPFYSLRLYKTILRLFKIATF